MEDENKIKELITQSYAGLKLFKAEPSVSEFKMNFSELNY